MCVYIEDHEQLEWFTSQGHYCHKCNEEIKCPNCGSNKVENQGYEVYLCRECDYQLKHLTADSQRCRTV